MTEHDCNECKYFHTEPIQIQDTPCYDCKNAHSRLRDNFTPLTHADRIRKMSDKELETFLYWLLGEHNENYTRNMLYMAMKSKERSEVIERWLNG